jgi:hypothetical protein
MSIYIEGMEMPKNCEDCPFGWYTRTGEKFCLTMIHGWQSNCPLIPVPNHGDLIDRDELLAELHLYRERLGAGFSANEVTSVMNRIRNQKTVIQANPPNLKQEVT